MFEGEREVLQKKLRKGEVLGVRSGEQTAELYGMAQKTSMRREHLALQVTEPVVWPAHAQMNRYGIGPITHHQLKFRGPQYTIFPYFPLAPLQFCQICSTPIADFALFFKEVIPVPRPITLYLVMDLFVCISLHSFIWMQAVQCMAKQAVFTIRRLALPLQGVRASSLLLFFSSTYYTKWGQQ